MINQNSNILTPPYVEDGYKTLDPKIVDQLFKGYLRDSFSEHTGYNEYSHLAVGSDSLARYYEEVVHLRNVWAGVAVETGKPQYVATVNSIGTALDISLGLIQDKPSEGGWPKETWAKLLAERAERKYFGLCLNMGAVMVDYRGSDVGKPAVELHHQKYNLFGSALEQTIWERDAVSGLYAVERLPRHTKVAFGEVAITSLPEFPEFAAAFECLTESELNGSVRI